MKACSLLGMQTFCYGSKGERLFGDSKQQPKMSVYSSLWQLFLVQVIITIIRNQQLFKTFQRVGGKSVGRHGR